MTDCTDQEARDAATKALHLAAVNHVELTAKITEVAKGNETILAILKWAGGLVVSLFLTCLGWLVLNTLSANDQAKKDMQTQIELLRQQESNRVAAREQTRESLEEIKSQLPAGATESTRSTRRHR